MKAIVSSTHDSKYFFFLPIVTWCWNRLGVDIICFLPQDSLSLRFMLASKVIQENCASKNNVIAYFDAPEHKQATYAQCARLYAACLDLPEDEILVTSDIDMVVFSIDKMFDVNNQSAFQVLGSDLTPQGQYPMCYVAAPVRAWRSAFHIEYGHGSIYGDLKYAFHTYQEKLDSLLGKIECEEFRGNFWSKDQEELFNRVQASSHISNNRARPGTQFAANRVDRDDINWRSYVDDDLIDAHLWRPGYTDENFANILELLQMKYPNDNFDWLVNYRNEYLKLL